DARLRVAAEIRPALGVMKSVRAEPDEPSRESAHQCGETAHSSATKHASEHQNLSVPMDQTTMGKKIATVMPFRFLIRRHRIPWPVINPPVNQTVDKSYFLIDDLLMDRSRVRSPVACTGIA